MSAHNNNNTNKMPKRAGPASAAANPKKRKVFDPDSVPQGTLNNYQYKVLKLCMEGKNVAILGSAGTGKSYLLARIKGTLDEMGLKVAITASTGIAASNLNLGASTLHSFIGAGLADGTVAEDVDKVEKNLDACARIRDCQVLIIDEVSMISPYFFYKVDIIMRTVRRVPTKSFGGCQIIVCGDWAQLDPVKKMDSLPPPPYSEMTYCFQTDAFQQAFSDGCICVLKEIFRQKDPVFVEILSQIREGKISKKNLQILKSRVRARLDVPDGIRPTKLYPKNWQVDKENNDELEKLDGDPIVYKLSKGYANIAKSDMKHAGILVDKLVAGSPAEQELKLKIGAMVVLTVNLCTEDGLVNGLQGVVVDFQDQDEPDTTDSAQKPRPPPNPIVRFVNGHQIEIETFRWTAKMKNKNKKKTPGQFSGVWIRQIPLRLAFALTMHKAQGMTLNFLEVNLGEECFAAGQAYTALARGTSLNGISITEFAVQSIIYNSLVKDFYAKYSGEHEGNQLSYLSEKPPEEKDEEMLDLDMSLADYIANDGNNNNNNNCNIQRQNEESEEEEKIMMVDSTPLDEPTEEDQDKTSCSENNNTDDDKENEEDEENSSRSLKDNNNNDEDDDIDLDDE